MVDDRAWADDLRAKGYERAKGYTWQACADRTAEVLRQMA
jgi:glycosyltransferase involved in cell wall biosynthesis